MKRSSACALLRKVTKKSPARIAPGRANGACQSSDAKYRPPVAGAGAHQLERPKGCPWLEPEGLDFVYCVAKREAIDVANPVIEVIHEAKQRVCTAEEGHCVYDLIVRTPRLKREERARYALSM